MKRVDQILVERGLCPSREKAKRAIMAGQVRINDHRAAKPSDPVRETDRVELLASDRYVSRGGHKLEYALKHFALDPTGLVVVDLGASTGGFTDCWLQHGARQVYAVDVGRGQLSWRLRQDARVTVMDQVNARNLTQLPAGALADLVSIDCSFISLKKILPAAQGLLRVPGRMIVLLKPQFEAGKAEADKGHGVITDPAVHQRVVDELADFVKGYACLAWRGAVESPLKGPAGNKEYLILLEKLQ